MIDDDYDDLDGETPRKTGWATVIYRWLLGFGGVAALVFGGVYLVYSFGGDGTDATRQGSVPLIRAAQGPVKVRPAEPGGRVVPHQDREVYREYDAARRGDRPGVPVEDLLAPGKPQPAAKRAGRPKGPAVVAAGPVCRPVPTLLADTGRYRRTASRLAATKLAASEPALPKKAATARVATPPKRAAPKVASTTVSAAGNASAGVRKPSGKDRRAAKAGSIRVQLGAFRTLAKARNRGRGLQRQHSSLLGRLNMVVERVDLGQKGIFYRLRAGPIANRQTARSLCRTLGKRRIDCFLVSG